MPFRAINTFEEELLAQEQRHTLELRLEEAMKLFQLCLEAQARKSSDTGELYAALFETMPGHGDDDDGENGELLPPAARRLRAMALKNYAVFLLDTDPGDSLLTIVTSISKCLELTEGRDAQTLELAAKVCFNLGWFRLARLGLEAVATDVSSSWTTLSPLAKSQSKNRANLLNPHDKELLESLETVVARITSAKSPETLPSMLKVNVSLPSVEPSIDRRLELVVMEPTWQALATSVLSGVSDTAQLEAGKYLAWFRAPHDLSFSSSSGTAGSSGSGRSGSSDEAKMDVSPILKPSESDSEKNPSDQSLELPANEPQNALPTSTVTTGGDSTEGLAIHDPNSLQGGIATSTISEDTKTIETEQKRPPKRLLRESDGPSKRHTTAERASKRGAAQESEFSTAAEGEVELLAIPADFGATETFFTEAITRYLGAIPATESTEFVSPATSFISSLEQPSSLSSRLLNWSDKEESEFNTVPPRQHHNEESQDGERTDESSDDSFLSGSDSSKTSSSSNARDDVMRLLESASLPSPASPSHGNDLFSSEGVTDFTTRTEGMYILEVLLLLALEILDRHSSSPMALDVVDAAEPVLWSQRESMTFDRAQRLYELFADVYLRGSSLPALKDKLARWRFLSASLRPVSGDKLPQLRHAWISALVDQTSIPALQGVERFEEVHALIVACEAGDAAAEEDGELYNFGLPSIPHLSASQASTQIAKWKAAAVFERVFASPEPHLLEAMLLPGEASGDLPPEIASIRTFLSGASSFFKLRLWQLLLDAHLSLGNMRSARIALFQMLHSMRNASALRRLAVAQEVAADLVSQMGNFCGAYSSQPEASETNSITVEEAHTALPIIVSVLSIFEEVSFFEEAVADNHVKGSDSPKWPGFARGMRTAAVRWWAIFYVYYRQAFVAAETTRDADEHLADLMSIIHERLGRAGMCSEVDGLIVRLHLSELVRCGLLDTEVDLAQCLSCRYGLVLGLSPSPLANHPQQNVDPTTPDHAGEMQALAPLLSRMILAKKSPGVALTRTDLRNVLDVMWAAIGAPQEAEQVVGPAIRSASITTETLHKAWTGCLILVPPIPSRQLEVRKAVGDFFFVVALAQLGQCRVRRRAGTTTELDLEAAIGLYLADLVAFPDRTESWLGVAQLYDMVTEIRVSSTPMRSTEEIADSSRQCIVASSMALSCLISQTSSGAGNNDVQKHDERLRQEVVAQFGRALVLGSLAPLSGTPFTSDPPRKYVLRNTSLAVMHPVPDWKLVLKLGTRSLRHSDPFLAAHAAQKLGDVTSALKLAAKALPEADAAVYILEIVLSATVKGSESLGQKQALKWVERAAASQKVKVTETELLAALEQTLKGILGKTKWLHRPRYLLAKVYWRLNNVEKATEELGDLFSLKTGEPLRIWRTDGEWPGLRAVYMLEYWLYYVDLLREKKDEVSLGRLTHRFRRFTSEVYDHQRGWEHTTQAAVDVGRQLLGFEVRYSDRHLSDLPNDFRDHLGAVEIESPWAPALAWALELRRLNNGYGVTAGIDDFVVCIFLKMWNLGVIPTASTPPPQIADEATTTATPGGTDGSATTAAAPAVSKPRAQHKVRRVARKDVLQAAQQIMRSVLPKLNKLDDLCIPAEIRRTPSNSPNETGPSVGLTSPRATPQPSTTEPASTQSVSIEPAPVQPSIAPASGPAPIPASTSASSDPAPGAALAPATAVPAQTPAAAPTQAPVEQTLTTQPQPIEPGQVPPPQSVETQQPAPLQTDTTKTEPPQPPTGTTQEPAQSHSNEPSG